MRSSISLATFAFAAALALVAACSPRDGSAPASNTTAAHNSAPASNVALTNAAQEPPPQTTAPEEPNSDVRRVTQDELRAGMQEGKVALFDVRDQTSYEAGHIKDAKLVPWDQVENRLAEFPKDKLIVTYCA
jgi:hypothetical protein